MTSSYSELYLDQAMHSMAIMLDHAVYDMNYELEIFYNLFLYSRISRRFGRGDFTVVAGKSGVEIAREVLEEARIPQEPVTPVYSYEKTPEYWAGWVLAWYQWKSGLSFKEINSKVPITVIRRMYYPYHEMDLSHFGDKMDELIQKEDKVNKLKQRRNQAGFTIEELSERSGISLGTLEKYENGEKDLNKAAADTVYRLSKALKCSMEDLIEIARVVKADKAAAAAQNADQGQESTVSNEEV